MSSLQAPSRNDVELCIRALEIEDEREKEALRKFYAREREAIDFKWANLLRWPVLWRSAVLLACVAALLWLWP